MIGALSLLVAGLFLRKKSVEWEEVRFQIGADFHTNCFFVGGIVGDEGGEIGGNWEKISTFVCANMQLLFNPLKFYDYDEH